MTFLPGIVPAAGHSTEAAAHGREGHHVTGHPRADVPVPGDLLEAGPAPAHAPLERDAEQLEEAASAEVPELTHAPAKTNGKRASRVRSEGAPASFAVELAKNVEAADGIGAAAAESDRFDDAHLSEPSTDEAPGATARREPAGMPRPVVNGSDETPNSDAMSVSPRLTTGSHVHADVKPEARSFAVEHPTLPDPARPETVSLAGFDRQVADLPPAASLHGAGPTARARLQPDTSSSHDGQATVENHPVARAPQDVPAATVPPDEQPVSSREGPPIGERTAPPPVPFARTRSDQHEPTDLLSSPSAPPAFASRAAPEQLVGAAPSAGSAPAVPTFSPPLPSVPAPSSGFVSPALQRNDRAVEAAPPMRPRGGAPARAANPTAEQQASASPSIRPVPTRSAARAGAAYALMTTDSDSATRPARDFAAVPAPRADVVPSPSRRSEDIAIPSGSPSPAAPRAPLEPSRRTGDTGMPVEASRGAIARSTTAPAPVAGDAYPAAPVEAPRAKDAPAAVTRAPMTEPAPRPFPSAHPDHASDRPAAVENPSPPAVQPHPSAGAPVVAAGGPAVPSYGRAVAAAPLASVPVPAQPVPALRGGAERTAPVEAAPAPSGEPARHPIARAPESTPPDRPAPTSQGAEHGPPAQPRAALDQAPTEPLPVLAGPARPTTAPHRTPTELADEKTSVSAKPAAAPPVAATPAAPAKSPSTPPVVHASHDIDRPRRDDAVAPVQASASATVAALSVPTPAAQGQAPSVAPKPQHENDPSQLRAPARPHPPALPRSPDFSIAPPASSGVSATGESTAAHPTPHVDSSSAVPPLFRLSETRRVQAAHLDLAQQSYQPGIVATPSPSAKGFGTGSRVDKGDKQDKSKKDSPSDPPSALVGPPSQLPAFAGANLPLAPQAAPRSAATTAPSARTSRAAQPVDAIHALASHGPAAPAASAPAPAPPHATLASTVSKGRLAERQDEPSSPREVMMREATAAPARPDVAGADRPSKRSSDGAAALPAAEARPGHPASVATDRAPAAPATHAPALSPPAPETPVAPPAAPPAPLAAQPLYELATSDPSLQATLGKNAHVHLDAGAAGPLSLHLTMRDGVADLEVEGPAADRLNMRPEELRRALAGEGISLGQFVSRAHDSADARAQQDGSHNQGGNQAPGERAQADASPRPAATPFAAQSGASSYHGESRRQWQNEAPDFAERDRRPGSAAAATSTSNTSDAAPARRRGVHVTA
jgi:hypothetical protein